MWRDINKIIIIIIIIITNLAYSEDTNAYFKCNKILKLSDKYKLQVSNYIFELRHSNIDLEIESRLLVNNQINRHTQDPTTKWEF